MRSASLEPYKSVNSPNRPWCVDVPAYLSDNGKRKRKFFETKKLAEAECEKLEARRDNFGVSLNAMTPSRIAEAAECFKLLEGSSVSLLDAVHGFLAVQKVRRASISFLELFNGFLEAKKDRNEQYQRELRITRDRFPQFHKKLVSDITYLDLEKPLLKISPGGRNAVMRCLRAVFNFGIKRGYLIENPISRLDFAERPRKEVETLTNEQARKMLEHALEQDLQLLPYLALGLFCGIRPDGELQKVEWKDISLTDKVVTIRPEVSKTKRRRFIDLSDNAKSWLESFVNRGGISHGLIIGEMTESELRGHRTANWTAAEITDWPQSAMRHTYCSNWLAVHQDVNKLVLQSGHDSVDRMWRHYHRGTTEADATAFWSIKPG